MRKQCESCGLAGSCHSSVFGWTMAYIGMAASLAYRLVTLCMHHSYALAEGVWYFGTVGFLIFFGYKYRQFKRRAEIIESSGLLDRTARNQPLTEADYAYLKGLLCSLRDVQERINFQFIFIISGLSLAVSVIADLLRRS